jgi:hypothetical protein
VGAGCGNKFLPDTTDWLGRWRLAANASKGFAVWFRYVTVFRSHRLLQRASVDRQLSQACQLPQRSRWSLRGRSPRSRVGLNYDPKLHMRHRLDPLDLYVRHTSTLLNAVLKRILPLLEPTRRDKTLRKFANFDEIWGRP